MFEPVKKEASNKTVRLPNDLIEKIEHLAYEKDLFRFSIAPYVDSFRSIRTATDDSGARSRR